MTEEENKLLRQFWALANQLYGYAVPSMDIDQRAKIGKQLRELNLTMEKRKNEK